MTPQKVASGSRSRDPFFERWAEYVVHLPGQDAPYTDYQEVAE